MLIMRKFLETFQFTFQGKSCFLMSKIVWKTSKSLATPSHIHTHTSTQNYTYMALYMHMQLLFWQRVVGFPLCFIATSPMSRMTMSNCHAPLRRCFASTSTATTRRRETEQQMMTTTGNCQQSQTALSAGNFDIGAGRCCHCCTNELLPLT